MLSAQCLKDCQLLKGVARVVELSAVATTTAFTYLHRIQLGQHSCDLSSQELVCACIYLAAKVEEEHLTANQLINTGRVLADPTQRHLLQALAPLDLHKLEQLSTGAAAAAGNDGSIDHAKPPPAPASPSTAAAAQGYRNAEPAGSRPETGGTADPSHNTHDAASAAAAPSQAAAAAQQPSAAIVVGDEYYAAKERLFMAEQVVLRLMHFELGVQHPHKYLFNFCRLLHVSNQGAAAAVCVLNDAIAYTALVVQHEAAVVAAAALQHALLSLPELLGHASVMHETAGATAGEGATSKDSSMRAERRGSRSRNDSFTDGRGVVADQQLVQSGEWVGLVGLQPSEVATARRILQKL